jgi:hypothetical protein
VLQRYRFGDKIKHDIKLYKTGFYIFRTPFCPSEWEKASMRGAYHESYAF